MKQLLGQLTSFILWCQLVTAQDELTLIVSDHLNSSFDGIYYQEDDWNDQPHYATSTGAHFYYHSSGYWQFDSREQDGTEDWYDGGYVRYADSADFFEDIQQISETVHFKTSVSIEIINDNRLNVSGHLDSFYDGVYYLSDQWNGYPHFTNMNGAHFYYYQDQISGYWHFDDRKQDGTHDWYHGGYARYDQYEDLIAEIEAGSDIDFKFEVNIRAVESESSNKYLEEGKLIIDDYRDLNLDVSGLPDSFYDGLYYPDGEWNGYPHFTTGTGAHLYFFYTGREADGFWQFDDRGEDHGQDGTEDWYNGGYYYCPQSPDDFFDRIQANNGILTFPYKLNMEVIEDDDESLSLDVSGHPNSFYDGLYYQADEWNGYPHFTTDTGAHFYYHDSQYWHFDDRWQDGTENWFNGGYLGQREDDIDGFFEDIKSGSSALYFYYSVNVQIVQEDPDEGKASKDDIKIDEGTVHFNLSISQHEDSFYDGLYYQDGTWNGYPHLTNGMGAHLYYHDSGYWQFDERTQDGTSDYYNGGYYYCESSPDDLFQEIQSRFGTVYFSTGNIRIQIIEGDITNLDSLEIIQLIEITGHSDDLYNGLYRKEGEVDGQLYLVNMNQQSRMYFYDPDGDNAGYLQLDNRLQAGSLDFHDGGYTYCADLRCGVTDEDLASGSWEMSFEDPSEELTFTLHDQQSLGIDEHSDMIHIVNHTDDFYNGLYAKSTSWNDYVHFENSNGAVLYYFQETCCHPWIVGERGYWLLDDRQQDGKNLWYNGGYLISQYYEEDRTELIRWNQNNRHQFYAKGVEGENQLILLTKVWEEKIYISKHVNDTFNGNYFRMEDWNNQPHFAKEDRSAHLFYAYGYWQLDSRESDGDSDYYDGGYLEAGDNYRTDLIGTRNWEYDRGNQQNEVTFTSGCVGCATVFVTISDHTSDYYNGVYWQAEDWDGSPHFEKEEGGSAHLHCIWSYWELDYRDQDGTEDYYNGGYKRAYNGCEGLEYLSSLVGVVTWNNPDKEMSFEWSAAVYEQQDDWFVEEPYVHVLNVSGHVDDFYDGIYLRDDDWNDFPHFEKYVGSISRYNAHLYFYYDSDGVWQFDYRDLEDQDGTEENREGGYFYSPPNIYYVQGEFLINGTTALEPFNIIISPSYEENQCSFCGKVQTDDGYYTKIQVTGHDKDDYNVDYWRVEDWNDYPHFTSEGRANHLFYNQAGQQWQLDNTAETERDVADTEHKDGGYTTARNWWNWEEDLGGESTWTYESRSETEIVLVCEIQEVDAETEEGAEEQEAPAEPEDEPAGEEVEETQIAVVIIENHSDDSYNGVYYLSDEWNGYEHYATASREAHLYYFESFNIGYWQLDWREQDGTEDNWDGGYVEVAVGAHISELEGEINWETKDDEVVLTIIYNYYDISSAPECWGSDADYFTTCMEHKEFVSDEPDTYYYTEDEEPGLLYYLDPEKLREDVQHLQYYWSDYVEEWAYYLDPEALQENAEMLQSQIGADIDLDLWYYYGDDWSFSTSNSSSLLSLQAEFRDFFHYAAIWTDGTEPADCEAVCSGLASMCCAGVSLQQGDTYLNEVHCMNKQVVDANLNVVLADQMHVSLSCPDRGNGAKYLALGMNFVASVLILIQFLE